MRDRKISYLNTGIYTVAEASRLTGVSKARIRRWLRGYHSELRKKKYPPLWESQLPSIENKVALGFLDLIEIKFKNPRATLFSMDGNWLSQRGGYFFLRSSE